MPQPFPLDSLPNELAQLFTRAWQRFEQSCTEQGETALTTAVVARAALGHTELPAVWIASDFVATACIRNPRLLAELLASNQLDQRVTAQELTARVEAALADCPNQAQLDTRLRQIRRREMVRLAWRDLSVASGRLEETMEGVSALAEACLEGALRHHHDWLSARFGVPRDEQGEAVGMVVLGLGKLGGRELNYSSDIDLIFAYDGAGETDGERVINNQEYFLKLGRKLIDSLNQVTTDGFVFRTDMRLRPNGDSGPLVLSFAAMEHYYQVHGRDWERYAHIKARIVAGDRCAGERLQQMLMPFVYRRYLDFGAFDSIREMRELIERQLKKKGMGDDIKLGRGGIREVEFLVQCHQLIRGGRDRALRMQSLHLAMQGLVDAEVFTEVVRANLLEDYSFLRNTEHRLQMVDDRQTQQLPESGEYRLRLAWSMGFDCWEQYLQQLDHHRERVHSAFQSLVGLSAGALNDSGNPQPDNPHPNHAAQRALLELSDLWHGVLDERVADRALTAAGFSDTQSVSSLLGEFRNGRLYQRFSGVDCDRVDRLIPLALREAGGGDDPGRSMAAFISVIESIGRRSAYLSLLIENPQALKQMLALCAASPWISRHIGMHPVVLDELLSPSADVRARDDEEVAGEMAHRLVQCDEDDAEAYLNAMREFTHAQVLRVAAADVLGALDADEIGQALSRLARVVLTQVFEDALASVKDKLGTPPARAAGVIAYGKFAGNELGYHSDLDIVVCYDAGQHSARGGELEYYYSRICQRLIHLLTVRTRAGQLYELDMRLRPSGNSGTLVTSLDGFAEYQLSGAWTWEHQALVRARAVVGGDDFIARFEQVRQRVLCCRRDAATLKSDIVTMKNKMMVANCSSDGEWCDLKLGWGGIVDIEFLLQYLVLREAHEHPEIIGPRRTCETIVALQHAKIISEDASRRLQEIYQTYLRKSLDLKLMGRPLRVACDELVEQRETVQALWAEFLRA